MSPFDYADWAEVSGIYLDNFSKAEKYQTYLKQLSPPGLNTVIITDFLNDNPQEIDIPHWISYSVYEFGEEKQFRVQKTVEAFREIGAENIANNITSTPSRSPAEMLMNITDPEELMKTITQLNPASFMHDIKKQINILSGGQMKSSDVVLDEQDENHQETTADCESRLIIEELLNKYCEKHAATLAADIARHGDPRLAAGYTKNARLAELAHQFRQLHIEHEQAEIAGKIKTEIICLRQRLENAGNDEKLLKRCNKVWENIRELIADSREYEDAELTSELKTQLSEVEVLKKDFPDYFNRSATTDENLNQRLAAIGEYFVDSDGITFEAPQGMISSIGQYSVKVRCNLSKLKIVEKLANIIENLQKRFNAVSANWEQELIENFRDVYELGLSPEELDEFEQDENGFVTAECILKNASDPFILLEVEDGELFAQTSYNCEWDIEHGYEIGWTKALIRELKQGDLI